MLIFQMNICNDHHLSVQKIAGHPNSTALEASQGKLQKIKERLHDLNEEEAQKLKTAIADMIQFTIERKI